MVSSFLALAVAASALAGPPAPRYSMFVFPPLEGAESAYPSALGSDGTLVGSASPKPFHPQSVAVMTTGDVLASLPSEFRAFNAALGTADSGLVVGIMGLAPASWSDGEGELLAPIPGYFSGAAWDANESGVIVGTHTNDLVGFDFPVYWPSSETAAIELPFVDSPSGAAFAINDAGAIAGALSVEGALRAVRWDAPTLAPVVLPLAESAIGSEALAINALGDVAGRCMFPDFSSRAMAHWREENVTLSLGTLGGFGSEARAVNASRQVVGLSATPGAMTGFLWTDGTMRDLNDLVVHSNDPSARITLAADIDDDGRIAAEVIIGGRSYGPRRIALLTPCRAADLDCNGSVDAGDLAILLGGWGRCDECPADLDQDGAVTAGDLALLLGGWG